MKANSRTSALDPALILLLFTAFLTPLFGGYIFTDTTALGPGLGTALATAFGGSDAPLLSHALICLPMFIGVVLVLVKRRVQQVPKQLFFSIWAVFFLFLGFSTFFSSFRAISVIIWLEWLCYGVSMFATVSIGGRKLGPLSIIAALASGASFVAIKSILEYGAERATDPTWRVFGGWMNPNATAVILFIGFFLSLALCLSQARAGALISGIGAVLCGFAIVLTGSKGGVSLAIPIAMLSFAVLQVNESKRFLLFTGIAAVLGLAVGALFVKNIGWLGIGISSLFTLAVLGGVLKNRIGAGRVAAILVCSGFLIFLLGATTPVKPGAPSTVSTPIGRVGAGSQTQDQSSEFRLNLWKSTIFLIKKKPITGYGLGSFRNEAARAGLTTLTVFAHSVYLQLWSEGGLVPFCLFIFGMGLWFRSVLRNRATLPVHNTLLLSGVVAAVVGVLSHSLVDSDLYYFGIGLPFFMLLGLALSLSSDAVAPELVQPPIRMIAGFATVGLATLLFIFSAAEDAKSVVRYDLQTGNSEAIRSDTDALSWVGSFDGDALYLQARTQGESESIKTLKAAYELSPTERIARYLAGVEAKTGQAAEAEALLQDALTRDPENFHTLNTLMHIQLGAGDSKGAIQTARKLVATEKTPYYLVRSIPESIPTESLDARIQVLAPAETNLSSKANLLAEAVRGYLPYASMKLHILKPNAAQQANNRDFQVPGFDSLNQADDKLKTAITAAQDAGDLYRKLGDSKDEAEMDVDRSTLAAALAG